MKTIGDDIWTMELDNDYTLIVVSKMKQIRVIHPEKNTIVYNFDEEPRISDLAQIINSFKKR